MWMKSAFKPCQRTGYLTLLLPVRHIRAFRAALNGEDQDAELDIDSPSTSHATIPRMRIRKVSALSDFAPINVTLPYVLLPYYFYP